MFSPLTNYETRQPAGGVQAYAFDEFITPEFDSASADAAISLLRELARAQESGTAALQEVRSHQRPYESTPPMPKLPPSEWRSLGGYFDYCLWADRERFMELDRAIAAAQRGQMYAIETDAGMS